MKTIKKEYQVFTVNELTQEARDKARQTFNEDNDYPFMSDCMNERLHELLEDNKIKDLNDTSKAGTKPTQVLYSLSHSQGDGAMFAGNFEWNGYQVTIKHSGHYYHENSKTINIEKYTEPPQEYEQADEKTCEQFDALYVKICKELEHYGYDFIDNEDSEENFINTCEANEYTFLANGTMFNG